MGNFQSRKNRIFKGELTHWKNLFFVIKGCALTVLEAFGGTDRANVQFSYLLSLQNRVGRLTIFPQFWASIFHCKTLVII